MQVKSFNRARVATLIPAAKDVDSIAHTAAGVVVSGYVEVWDTSPLISLRVEALRGRSLRKVVTTATREDKPTRICAYSVARSVEVHRRLGNFAEGILPSDEL